MSAESFVIFSQFNLRATNCATTREWVDARLKLFKKVTLPSLASQTDQDFRYVIAYRPDLLTREQRQDLNNMLGPNCVLVDVPEEQTNYPCTNYRLLLAKAGRDLLLQQVKPDRYGMVFTTRLDTDDGLARNYVERTKNAYNWSHYTKFHGYLFHPRGYAYYLYKRQFMPAIDEKFHIMTLREPIDTFKGVMYYKHTSTDKRSPVAIIPGLDPMWLKTLHENTISLHSRSRKDWRAKNPDRSTVEYETVKRHVDFLL